MSALEIYLFPCLSDNYGFLAHDPATGACASIDSPDAETINAALNEKGWRLTHILNTHHHHDHTGGNLSLKEQWECAVVGPDADAARIPGIDIRLKDGDRFQLGEAEAVVFDVPGHTSGHIAYYFADVQGGVCRRYPVRARLRTVVRRNARADVDVFAKAHGAAERHGGLLRTRIYASERRFRSFGGGR